MKQPQYIATYHSSLADIPEVFAYAKRKTSGTAIIEDFIKKTVTLTCMITSPPWYAAVPLSVPTVPICRHVGRRHMHLKIRKTPFALVCWAWWYAWLVLRRANGGWNPNWGSAKHKRQHWCSVTCWSGISDGLDHRFAIVLNFYCWIVAFPDITGDIVPLNGLSGQINLRWQSSFVQNHCCGEGPLFMKYTVYRKTRIKSMTNSDTQSVNRHTCVERVVLFLSLQFGPCQSLWFYRHIYPFPYHSRSGFHRLPNGQKTIWLKVPPSLSAWYQSRIFKESQRSVKQRRASYRMATIMTDSSFLFQIDART